VADGGDAAAKKKADEVYAEAAQPGADFAALAKKYSMDAGSASQGGDLGLAERSFFVKPFADAVFAMKVGEVTRPVKTEFGWHVIKLEQIETGNSRKFEDVRPELETEYRRTEAEKRFGESQEKIEQVAFEQNDALEPVAKALGLKIEEIPVFSRGMTGNELAASPKVVQAAFSADVLGGQNSKALEVAPGTVVVIRSTDHKMPAQQSLADVRASVTDAVRREAARTLALSAGESIARAVSSGVALEAAAKMVGPVAAPPPAGSTARPAPEAIVVSQPKFIGRTEPGVAPEVAVAVFGAAVPKSGERTVGTVRLANGDVAVYSVTTVKPGVLVGDGANERRSLEALAADAEFASYLTALRARADIRSNPSIFE
jgi:peptidyl-prolyl cis-trans isomerase D